MGTDVNEVVEPLPNPRSFKVHRAMCTELMKLVDRISRIFPDIEAARPRCSSGIQTLCLLNATIEKAKLLLQYCCESSKLYLALTGDAVLSRCQKLRKSLVQSLGAIQNMVPVMLALEISQIIDDLQSVTFILDSAEEEAGNVVRELLQQGTSASDLMENSEIKALKFAAARLNITSQKATVIEKRSIRKLLDKIGSNDSSKKMILRYLLYLLKRYGNLIMGEQMEVYADVEGPIASENSTLSSLRSHHIESDSCSQNDQHETHNGESSSPPEEYKCPISSRVMYDPVVIASGVTYERMWIKKWFDEGNDFCPKTRKQLVHMSLTPNIAMKDLISKWCRNNGVTIPDPSRKAEDFRSWEVSSTSIRSLGSSLNDLHLPADLSNISLGSLDTSYNSDSSHAKITHGLNSMLINTNDDSRGQPTQAHMPDTDLMLLSKLPDLQWDFQCQVIEKLKSSFKCNYQAVDSVSSENFIEPLIRFLRDAYDLHDVRALRAGTQVLLEFVSNCRNCVTYLTEDTFSMLGSFLDSEVIEEALAVMEELSGYAKIAVSYAHSLPSIVKILGSESREFQQRAVRIMYNLSFNGDICSHLLSLECIPKLLPFLRDRALARYCVCILKNLSDIEEGRISVVETKGCISSIAQILESGGNEEQEYALAVLLSLCSQRVDYCQLVMHEGVIPPLVFISHNGNERGKANALELLRLLRDVEYVAERVISNVDTSQDSNNQPQEKTSSKGSGFLKKLSVFSKSSTHASKTNR
ncbi:hypothetical protein L6164_020050 [Bauhinia variegata]|uniref:Uncharacterized protein n=1 Tax=Bauhinia variegata TaxID=167791 RepID=A0ACB9MV67_BAUVA|nr:hypothetical protein L6164_020050 [Bauhinia variegata]